MENPENRSDLFDDNPVVARRKTEEFISELTGWKGVSELAEWVIKFLLINVGRSADKNAIEGVKTPCWEDHAPVTMAEFKAMMVEMSNRAPDDPLILWLVEERRQTLIKRFGL